MSSVSSDLLWELVRPYNSFLVKRRSGGGVQLSRDPLNLLNKHSRKHAGFVNEKAIGVQAGDKGGVVYSHKKVANSHQPSSHTHSVNFAGHKPGRRTYRTIGSHASRNRYRADLERGAIARASAILKSQQPKKDSPKKKLRGAKAKKAAEASS